MRYKRYDDLSLLIYEIQTIAKEREFNLNSIMDFCGDVELKLIYIKDKLVKREVSESYIKNLNNKFRLVAKFEKRFNKDVYLFTIEELFTTFKNLNFKSMSTLLSFKSFINGYVNLAISEKLARMENNSFKVFNKEMAKICLSKSSMQNKYVKHFEYLSFMEVIKDSQDKLFFMLIWKGLYDKDFETLRNIKLDDIDLFSRSINVDKEEILFSKEEFYIVKEVIISDKMGDVKLLSESEFLFKPVLWSKTTSESRREASSFRKRFASIVSEINRNDLKVTSLFLSGLHNKYKRLGVKDYRVAMLSHGMNYSTMREIKATLDN